jgi:hypothetical protein
MKKELKKIDIGEIVANELLGKNNWYMLCNEYKLSEELLENFKDLSNKRVNRL